jgi:hypothetical protein
MLGAMLFFFRATEKQFSLFPYTFSIVLFFLGLASKESAVVLPALLILFDYYFIAWKDRTLLSRIKYHLPFWTIMAAGFVYNVGRIAHPEMYDRPWLTHLLTEIKVFVEYLRLMIIPLDCRSTIQLQSQAHSILALRSPLRSLQGYFWWLMFSEIKTESSRFPSSGSSSI